MKKALQKLVAFISIVILVCSMSGTALAASAATGDAAYIAKTNLAIISGFVESSDCYGFEPALAMLISGKAITYTDSNGMGDRNHATYTYDEHGRVIGIVQDNDCSMTIARNEQGDVIAINYLDSDGNIEESETDVPVYDANGRLIGVSASRIDLMNEKYTLDSAITYDNIGRISAVNQIWTSSTGGYETISYVFQYNSLNRVSQYSHSTDEEYSHSVDVHGLTYNRYGQPLKDSTTVHAWDVYNDVTYTISGKWSYKKDLTLVQYTILASSSNADNGDNNVYFK